MRIASQRAGFFYAGLRRRQFFCLIADNKYHIIMQSSMEQEENEKLVEDFPFVNNSAEFLRILFGKKTLTIFLEGRGK
jgi:hypothetical protein